MKIAIGIVTYNNTNEELENWLLSLENAITVAKENFPEFECLLYWIDNGESTNHFSHLSYSKQLESRGNVGYTVAINLLIKESMKDKSTLYFHSANPDGVFHPYFFKELLPFIEKFPDSIIESSQFPEEHPKVYNPKTFDTEWASGAAVLYPRAIIEKIGLMDENFFMYCEDVDYSWRARLNGFTVKHCPTAYYGHHVINRLPSRITTKYFYESGRYLARKWASSEFAIFCEQTLINEKYYADISDLPTLIPDKLGYKQNELDKISNFKYYFYFSEGRW